MSGLFDLPTTEAVKIPAGVGFKIRPAVRGESCRRTNAMRVLISIPVVLGFVVVVAVVLLHVLEDLLEAVLESPTSPSFVLRHNRLIRHADDQEQA